MAWYIFLQKRTFALYNLHTSKKLTVSCQIAYSCLIRHLYCGPLASHSLGMGSALETLCGQAYGGKQFHLLGIYMQRALIVLNLAAILISFMWFYMGKILLMLHQDPAIAAKAGEYARWLIPGLF
ncbi:hypothetical protein O6H91_Y476800 [Diphasiastrum complanatum]|nr:hypothetical protein O6H91_Y476800 [Diphasiastrum complanatum]